MSEIRIADRVDQPTVTTILAALREVLAQIDSAGLPADIGAHIDLALCRLEDLEGVPRPANH